MRPVATPHLAVASPPSGRPAGCFTADALAGQEIPERVWQFPGWMPAGTVSLLSGDGGLGKSTIALQACVSTVTGSPWFGLRPRTGPALYLTAEDDRDELHRRLADITISEGVKLSALAGLTVWPLVDQEAVLAKATLQGQLEPTPLHKELRELALSVGPALIVLDAAADLFSADENDRSSARQAIALLRRLAIETEAAVLLLSHPSLQGLNSGSGRSGSTAWSNSVRSRLYLSKPEKTEDPTGDLRSLQLMKANYGPSSLEMRLRYRFGAFARDADSATAENQQAEDVRVEALFLQRLASFNSQCRVVSHSPGSNFAPRVFAQADPRGPTQKGFEKAMERLFQAKKIRVETIGPPSKSRSSLVLA